MGLMTALAIGLHNFPEGLATFVGTLDDPTVGIPLAIAIAIHNIPEGYVLNTLHSVADGISLEVELLNEESDVCVCVCRGKRWC